MFLHQEKTYNLAEAERSKLIERIRTKLSDYREIIFAYVYGSFAEGMPFRDIDLGIFGKSISERHAMEYMLALSQRIGSEIGLPTDIRLLNFAPITFLFHVIQGDLILDRDGEFRCDFVEQVLRNYLDMKPRIRRAIREAFVS
jgi:predicted nucleotidyltransferase